MSPIIGDELIHHMEKILLSDIAIKQAKIVDLADPQAPHQELVVAIALSDMVQQPDDAALRTARRNLTKKVVHLGGKTVVPKKWARPADLPVTPTGEVDEEALRCDLLGLPRKQASDAVEVETETLDEIIFRVVASCLHISQDQLVPEASFLENGGDSLLAIQVFQRLMTEDVSLRVPDIMRASCIAEFPSLVISHRYKPSRVHEVRLPVAEGPLVSVADVRV